MNGARKLPGQGQGNRRQTVGRFFLKICRKFRTVFGRQSSDSLPMIGRCSAGVRKGVARLVNVARGPTTFGWVSLEVSPSTGRTTHGGRRTCRFSAFSISFYARKKAGMLPLALVVLKDKTGVLGPGLDLERL